jgi:hypothetical protein
MKEERPCGQHNHAPLNFDESFLVKAGEFEGREYRRKGFNCVFNFRHLGTRQSTNNRDDEKVKGSGLLLISYHRSQIRKTET